MKSNKWMTAVAVLAFAATTAFASTGNGERRGGEGYGHRRSHQRLASKLNLTDAQRQQARALHESFRKDNEAFLQSFRQTRQDMRAARDAGDTAKLESLKAQFESQRAQMRQLRETQAQKFSSILTDEQRAQWEAMKAEREKNKQP